MTLNLIDPAQIPQFVGNLDELEAAARGLKSDGGNISKTGGDIHTKFQGLSAYYEAPEAEQLFATTRPVQQAAKTFGDSLATVSGALMEYAHTVRPIARQLQDLQRRAADFRKSIEGHPHWRSNSDRVKEHNDLWAEVNAAVSAFGDAARTAADKIDKIFNGTQYIADDGSHKPNMYGYSADTLDHAKGLPWGEPVEQTYRGWDIGHWAGQFWDGFVIDGVGGALSGLGHLINPFDWHTFTQTWSGLGHVAVGFYARYGPNPAAAGYSVANGMDPGGVSGLPTGELPQWMQDDKKTFSNFAKSMVAWDEWKKNPVRAAGSTLFNGVTLAAGPAAKLGEAGDAGRFAMAAKTAGVLGKAGRIVDPMTYISKGVGQVASKLPRISDIAAAIDHFKAGDTYAVNDLTKLHGVELPKDSFKFTNDSLFSHNGEWHSPDTAANAHAPHVLATVTDVPHTADHLSGHNPLHPSHDVPDPAGHGPYDHPYNGNHAHPAMDGHGQDQAAGHDGWHRSHTDEWVTGARRRPRDLLDDPAQTRWAQAAYDDFLHDDRDIAAISQGSADVERPDGTHGFSPDEIVAIKKHVFDTEHPIEDYETGEVVHRKFDPDPEIADAWIRLRAGRAVPEDYVLLNHEITELRYLHDHPGATYQEAHRVANLEHNWQSQVPLNKREDFEGEW